MLFKYHDYHHVGYICWLGLHVYQLDYFANLGLPSLDYIFVCQTIITTKGVPIRQVISLDFE